MLRSALFCSQNTSPGSCCRADLLPVAEGCLTKHTASAADDVSFLGWTIVPCRIAVMSASPRSLTTTAAVLHSIIYSENSAFVPVAG